MSAVETATQAIQAHDQLLLDQLQPLEQEAERLKSELAAIEDLAHEIRSRLKIPAAEPKRTKRGSRKPTKPCAKKADVMQVTRSLIKANQPIELSDLETKLKQELSSEQGFSLSGVALRFKECIVSDEFAPDRNGWICLASDGDADGSEGSNRSPAIEQNLNVDGSTNRSI